MCVGFWTLEHPDYALILCNNRDEYLSRPTKEAHFHSFGHKEPIGAANGASQEGQVLSGRDCLAGGTWLGLNRSGRLALLTNITEPPSSVMTSSRGYLVSSYLLSDPARSLDDEVQTLTGQDTQYSGFNLLLLSPSSQHGAQSLNYDAALVTNHGAGGAIESRPLTSAERSTGGISNGVDGQDAHEWPKVQRGIQSLKGFLGTLPTDIKEADLTDRLFELLTWRSAEPALERSQLRNTIYVDPIALPVRDDGSREFYGTRLSTIVLIRRDGQALFIERDVWGLDENGTVAKSDPTSERVYRFQLPTP